MSAFNSIAGSTFEAVAVLLTIGILGFLIIKRHMLPGQVLQFLNPLVIEVSLPSLVFVNIVLNFDPELMPGWWRLPLWWAGFTLCSFALSAAGSLLAAPNHRREFFFALFFQNAMFFPLPILASIFGPGSIFVASLFLFSLFHPSFYFSIYPLFFPKSSLKIRWDRILNPVLVCTLLAVAVSQSQTRTEIPGFFMTSLQTIAGMTIPLLMIMLGGNLYLDFQKRNRLYLLETYKFVMIKNILFPLIWLVVLLYLRPPLPVAIIILLESAMPPSMSIPAVTEKGGGNRVLVSQFLVASCAACIITLPAVMYFFARYYPIEGI